MKKRKRIYIAGPISGDENYMEKFLDAEKRIKKYYKNKGEKVKIVNPIRHKGKNYKKLIDKGLKALMTCDMVYALDGYFESKGASLEILYAIRANIEIKYENTEKIMERM